MSHNLKYSVGDRVKVIADKYSDDVSHGAVIGDVYTIAYAVKESREGEDACNYQEYKLDCAGWVCEDEIEAA